MQDESHPASYGPIGSLLNSGADLDELLELAAKFSNGEVILSHAAECLLVHLLKQEIDRLLRPGDELRQLNVSLRKEKNGISSVLFKKAR